ncbi:UBN2 domain-containing protein, partial [Cephalotus follicularis]
CNRGVNPSEFGE